RTESVVTITGAVWSRGPLASIPILPTGAIEIVAEDVVVQSAAEELPLPVAGEADYPEDIRLRYRYLDLRRDRIHANIMLRSQVIASIRRRMIDQGFTEFQTPILTASSPEGARDYLVPSRVHPGKFYALPQAPQMFKQLIMVAGFDRYFQIAPCFRDEDARADRSPGEFYQLDFEMSYVTQEDVFAAIEPVLAGVFEEFAKGRKVTPAGSFPRIPYREAMLKYGTDKPDLRNPIVITDVSEHFRGSGFGLFARIVEGCDVVRAIPAPGTAGHSRKFFDDMNDWARSEGHAGLGYITQKGGELGGPIAKNHGEEATRKLIVELGLGPDDGIFFAAGKEAQAAKLAGAARTRAGEQLSLIDENRFEFCWIVDFPMYDYDEEAKKVDFSHNPFSMPQGELEALKTKDPLDILAYQYDIVCNGVELSSGAIRNHRPDIMYKAFGIAGYSREDVDRNFSGMINAFKYGAPPHGGSAPGIDRIVMLIAGEPNIREVVLFPMNQKAEDLMMDAPSEVSMKQLRELHIRVVPPVGAAKKDPAEAVAPE
ncbi:MAG: aspS, partial [Alphaproteobacteria bacterium]|nr:aspS [Alphaproteobacteria bacterium]